MSGASPSAPGAAPAGMQPGGQTPGQTPGQMPGDAPQAGQAGGPAPPPGDTTGVLGRCAADFQKLGDACTDAAGTPCLCPEVSAPAACDLVGTFAVRAAMMVRWDAATVLGQTAVAPGQATNANFGIWSIRAEGDGLVADARGCGGETPDLCSPALSEAFGQGFPEVIWDTGSTPTDVWQLTASDTTPGSALSAGPVAAFFGLRMTSSDPLGTFPAVADDPGLMWVDDDGDGVPGVTAKITPPGSTSSSCSLPYGYLPVEDTPFPARASDIYMGMRTVAELTATIDDCDTITGTLTTHAADARIQGCLLESGEPCSDSQRAFLDEQPQPQEILGTTFTALRVDDASIACAAVRAMAFPVP